MKTPQFPDFDLSLRRYGASDAIYHDMFLKETNDPKQETLRTFKQKVIANYQKCAAIFNETDPHSLPKIPLVIHQIWLGSPVPMEFLKFMHPWANLQGFEYKLWTDAEVRRLNLHNQKCYDEARYYGEKSDILRYEILYNIGGLYLDVDMVYHHPDAANILALFHKAFDFYMGFTPLEHEQDRMRLTNAVIASKPKHPLLKKIIMNLNDNMKKYPQDLPFQTTGPAYISRVIVKHILEEDSEKEDNDLINAYLPPTFFYPLSTSELHSNQVSNYLKERVKAETIAIHLWTRTGSLFV